MHCPECGVEIVEAAGFCHKCGQRLDQSDWQFPSEGPEQAPPETAAAPSESVTPDPPDDQAPEPADRLREAASARQQIEEEPEEELWRGRFSSKAMIGAWALSGLITIALLVLAIWAGEGWLWWTVVVAVLLLWLYQFIVLKYRQWNIRYQLTNQRFIHETGILRRVTDRIEVIDMDDITLEQKLLERFVGVGTIRITSSDRTHPELLLLGIENGKDVAKMIDDIRRSERRRRGLHIESI